MLKQIKKREQGFTIIEVLIVLAIAGLIMLIVFLAVPALQRNNRNTQRRNDVSKLMAALQETTNNTSGQLPASVTSGTAPGFASNTSLSYYQTTSVSWTKNTSAPTVPTNTDADKVVMASFLKCSSDGQTATTSGATTRSVVAIFAIEQGGSATGLQQCIES